jgi:chromosome segregation ATPase
MNEDLINQLDEIESGVFEMIQEKKTANLKLESCETKCRKVETVLESNEKKHFIEENCFREKLKHLEEQILQMKFEYEERFKGLYEELKRCTSKGKIYLKEAETAKNQLRLKIVEILKLEDQRDEILEDEENRKEKLRKSNITAEKFRVTIEELAQEIAGIRKSLNMIESMKDKVFEVNLNLLKRSENLQENSEMLLSQIDDLRKENRTLRMKSDGKKDLIIGQLEVKSKYLTQRLHEAKEDKLSLEKQLGYVNQSVVDRIKTE